MFVHTNIELSFFYLSARRLHGYLLDSILSYGQEQLIFLCLNGPNTKKFWFTYEIPRHFCKINQ